ERDHRPGGERLAIGEEFRHPGHADARDHPRARTVSEGRSSTEPRAGGGAAGIVAVSLRQWFRGRSFEIHFEIHGVYPLEKAECWMRGTRSDRARPGARSPKQAPCPAKRLRSASFAECAARFVRAGAPDREVRRAR